MADSFSKKENFKKKQQKQKEKALRREERKENNDKGKSFDDMMYRRRAKSELGLGIEDNVALQIVRGSAQVIRGAGPGNRLVHALHYRDGHRKRHVLTPQDGQFSLRSLVE